MTAKTHLYAILEKAEEGDLLSRIVDLFIITLIVLNVTMVILETVGGIKETYGEFIELFETVCVLIFTVEYMLRIWCCTADKKFARPLIGRLAFMLTPLALIDFIAIFPYYVFLLVTIPPDYTLPLRLLRLFRMLKVGRYSHSMQMFGRVIWEKRHELYIAVFALMLLLIIVSSLMYFVEHHAQPEAFSSIPTTMWWGIVTLTTVGYGDVFPITPLGKFMGAIIAVLGVGMFALPAGILSSGFVEAMQESHRGDKCPHCGKDISAHG